MLAAPFWEGQVHDCQTGSITALATSFDDSFLLSAAQDGTLYIHVRTNVSFLAAERSCQCNQTAWPKLAFSNTWVKEKGESYICCMFLKAATGSNETTKVNAWVNELVRVNGGKDTDSLTAAGCEAGWCVEARRPTTECATCSC